MKRVFGFDVLKCDACGGRMRILCAINPPAAIKKILDCLGLPSRPLQFPLPYWPIRSLTNENDPTTAAIQLKE
jgi:hypothetical protein